MNPLRDLKVNQPGRLELLGPHHVGMDGTVRDISSTAIEMEFRDPEFLESFQAGEAVAFKYWDVFGLHRGETRVMRVLGERPARVAVSPPQRVELTQKRKFFRVHVSVPVTLQKPVHQGLGEPSVSRSLSEDLTPAGMRVPTEVNHPIGEVLDVSLDFTSCGLSTATTVKTRGRVIRTVPASSDPNLFATCIEFFEISERDQVAISLALFDLQRHVVSVH